MRTYAKLLDVLGILAGVAYAATAIVTTVDIVLRNTADSTVRGLVDVVEYGLFVTTFLAAPWVLRHNAHVQVDFLLTALPDRAARWLAAFGNLVGLTVSAVFLVFSTEVTLTAFRQGNLVLKSIVFPEWWVLSVLPVASLLLMAEFVRRLLLARRLGRSGEIA